MQWSRTLLGPYLASTPFTDLTEALTLPCPVGHMSQGNGLSLAPVVDLVSLKEIHPLAMLGSGIGE